MKKFPSSDPYYSLYALLGQTRRVIFNAIARELHLYGVSPRQSALMFMIESLGEEATPSQIAWWLLLEVHSVSESLARLVKRGLIRKIKKEKGRVIIQMTDEGHELHRRSSKRELLHKIMSSLNVEQRKELGELLYILRSAALREIHTDYTVSFEVE